MKAFMKALIIFDHSKSTQTILYLFPYPIIYNNKNKQAETKQRKNAS